MAVSLVGSVTVSDQTTESSSRTISHAVGSGTSTLLVLVMTRSYDATNPPSAWTVRYGGADLTAGLNTFADTPLRAGACCVWVGYLHAPTVGTANLTLQTATTQRGCVVLAFNLAGNKSSGSPIGASVTQRYVAGTATSVSLSIAAQATADNLVLGAFMVAQNTALTSFSGTGFTSDFAAQFGNFPNGTVRHKLNAAGTVAAGATWSGSTTGNIGGALIEILPAPTGYSDSVSETLTVGNATNYAQPSSAKRTDLAFLDGQATFTHLHLMQADDVSDGSWLRIGTATAASFMLRGRVNNGQGSANVYRWTYALDDGAVTVDTEAQKQTTSPIVLGLVQEPGSGAKAYVNGVRQDGYRSGQSLAGGLNLSGTLEIGAHSASAPAAATGILGREIIDPTAWSQAKLQLFARAWLDPGSVWGEGDEETAAETAAYAKRSPIAAPVYASTFGVPTLSVPLAVADPDGSDWTVTAVSQGGHGSVAITGGQAVSYSPTPGYSGPDEFSYTVVGAGKTSTARAFITVGVPVMALEDDRLSIDQDSPGITFDPLGNDAFSAPVQITGVSTPAHGTASVSADGLHVNYTPNSGYYGSDQFTYTVRDSYSTGTATINVTVNRVFVTAFDDDDVRTVAGTAVTINPLANDQGSGALVIASVTSPAHGTAQIQAGGTSIVYTPTAGYTGTDTFSYVARLAAGSAQDTGAITVTVGAAGSASITCADDTATTTAGTAIIISPLANDTASGAKEIESCTSPAHGTATVSTDRQTITYTPTAGYTGSDTFDYVARLTASPSVKDTGAVTITVGRGVAVVANDDSATCAAGGSATISPLGNDTPATGLQISAVTAPGHGRAVIQAGATSIVYTPASGYSGSDSFVYTAQHTASGATDTATVSITVAAAATQWWRLDWGGSVEPGSKRAWNVGVMSVAGSANVKIFKDYMGFQPAITGGKCFQVKQSENSTYYFEPSNWDNIIGGPWEDGDRVVQIPSMPRIDYINPTKDWILKQAGYTNKHWVYWGITVIPFGSTIDVIRAVIRGDHDDKYKRLGARLRYLIDSKGQDYRKVVCRACYEMNQDTALSIYTGVKRPDGSYYNGFFMHPETTVQMWQDFISRALSKIREGYGYDMHFACSPAYDSAQVNYSRHGWLSFDKLLVPEFDIVCGSYHPVDYRITTDAAVDDLVNALPQDTNPPADTRHTPAYALATAKRLGLACAFLEHNIPTETAGYIDGDMSRMDLAYQKFGDLCASAPNYVAFTCQLRPDMCVEAKFSSNATLGPHWVDLCKMNKSKFGLKS